MLPGSGITELSSSPSGIKPNPQRWKIQRRRLRPYRWCYDGKNLASDHLHSKTASILARRTLGIPATSGVGQDTLHAGTMGTSPNYIIRPLIEPEEVAGGVK